MRKYFLLIAYITSLALTQQGLKANLPFVSFKVSGSEVTPLTVKPGQYTSKYDCCYESDFYFSGFNFEDDENAKSKPVYETGPSWVQVDIPFIFATGQIKCRSSFRPVFSFNLFKLIRVFRL